jgi:WD40 repeat protein
MTGCRNGFLAFAGGGRITRKQETGRERPATGAKLEGHTSQVQSADFSPDGQRIVTTSYDRTARVWNAANGQLLAKLEDHTGGVGNPDPFTSGASAAFSPDGQRIVTASDDHTARVYRVLVPMR